MRNLDEKTELEKFIERRERAKARQREKYQRLAKQWRELKDKEKSN